MLTEYLLFNIVLLLGAVLFSIYAYFKYSYTYWARKGVPYLTPNFPLGNNPVLASKAFTYGIESVKWYNEFKRRGVKFGGVWSFANKVLVLVDPELVRDILTKDFNYFIDRDVYHADRDPYAKNLFVLEKEAWKNLRQRLTSTFTSAKMKLTFGNIKNCSQHLIDVIREKAEAGEDIDLKQVLDKYTMDVVGSVAFGLDFNCCLSDDKKFQSFAQEIIEPSVYQQLKLILTRMSPRLANKFGCSVMPLSLSNFFGNIIKENIEQRRRNNDRRSDFIQMLMDIEESNRLSNNPFTIEDVVANCILFFLAGSDTSTKTMMFALYEMARNLSIAKKVRKEIETVLQNHNNEFSYDALQEMTYLRQVVDETLRLYPPVFTLSRICQKDYKLRDTNVTIKKGTSVVVSCMGIQRDPEYFPNPEKFDPERFSPENKASIVPYTYIPFGEGPRQCIGLRLGIMQSSIGLVQILRSFKIEACSKTKHPLTFRPDTFTIEPNEVVWVKATKI